MCESGILMQDLEEMVDLHVYFSAADLQGAFDVIHRAAMEKRWAEGGFKGSPPVLGLVVEVDTTSLPVNQD